ncbi:DUF6873 family GME fold protein [Flammeovirga pacifica]|uniref:DUF6873 domain-containing protein n=1 Tax=Flammeovirga pacifica TaxID=915059 RepID=A0A1S1YU56_FLAPC|nr:hypothetical protein [Flammeovirga pacifica]OHX64560.1 hypothetical protein NH26_23595 [Flammeovirga pacifica]
MKAKLVFVDDRILPKVAKKLSLFAEHLIGFKTDGITYNSISCHPDIFLHQLPNQQLIIAPNIPIYYQQVLKEHNIDYTIGIESVGISLKDSTYYNCISTPNYIIHKLGFTSRSIIDHSSKKLLHIPQAYTRCSTLVLQEGVAITSDKGVEKFLKQQQWKCFYFDPKEIKIEDHAYGFLGGCCGIFNSQIMVFGNPLFHKDGKDFIAFCQEYGFEVIPLCDDKMYDGGGIFLF